MPKETVSIAHIRQDEWVNPFKATPEELIAGALDESGLLDRKTTINGRDAHGFFQAYCRKKSLFQEATRLGSILLKEKIITQMQLTQALQMQAKTNKPLGEVLTARMFCTHDDIARALERQKAIREDFYRLEQAKEARRGIWERMIRFLFDSRQEV